MLRAHEEQRPTGATLIHPLSTGITYSLIDKGTADKIPIVSIGYGRADAADGRVFPCVFPLITTYWSQAATMVRYIGEQVQWALEHLDIDARRLKQLGASGFMPPLDTSCADHEGSGLVRFLRWDGERWTIITDWMAPMPEDRKLVRNKYVDSAMRYAKEKGIVPRRCPGDAA